MSRVVLSIPRLCSVSVLGFVVLFPASGCDSRSRKASARLRDEVHQLKEELKLSKHEISELEAKLAEATDRDGGDVDMALNMPRVAAIELSPYSSLRWKMNSGEEAALDLHVTAVDGRSRAIQLTGTLDVVARFMPVNGVSIELGRVSLSEARVRDAWRAGVLGASYQVEMPIRRDLLVEDQGGIHVSARFTDALTGVEHDATVEVRVPARPGE